MHLLETKVWKDFERMSHVTKIGSGPAGQDDDPRVQLQLMPRDTLFELVCLHDPLLPPLPSPDSSALIKLPGQALAEGLNQAQS